MSLKWKFFWSLASTGVLFFCVGIFLSLLFNQKERQFLHQNDGMIAELRILGELKCLMIDFEKEHLIAQTRDEKLQYLELWKNQFLDHLNTYEKLIHPEEDLGLSRKFTLDSPHFKALLIEEKPTVDPLPSQWVKVLEKAIVNELEEMADGKRELEITMRERTWTLLLAIVAIFVGFLTTGVILSERLTRVIRLLTQAMTAFHTHRENVLPQPDSRWSKEEIDWLNSFASLISMLENSEKHRQQLYRFLVHDLNGAIGSQSLSLKLFHKKYIEEIGPSEDLNILIHCIDSMQKQIEQMVKDLYDTQNLQNESFNDRPELLNVLDCVESWTDSYQSVFQHWNCKVQLHIPETLHIWADQYLLTRVLQNLFHNSSRYLPIDQGIIIIKSFELDANTVRLTFQDNGPGIAPERRIEVFKEGISDSRASHSKGLGLFFCKLALAAMNGQICIDPQTEVTIFCIDIPKIAP